MRGVSSQSLSGSLSAAVVMLASSLPGASDAVHAADNRVLILLSCCLTQCVSNYMWWIVMDEVMWFGISHRRGIRGSEPEAARGAPAPTEGNVAG